jgi:hypothetical protein
MLTFLAVVGAITCAAIVLFVVCVLFTVSALGEGFKR